MMPKVSKFKQLKVDCHLGVNDWGSAVSAWTTSFGTEPEPSPNESPIESEDLARSEGDLPSATPIMPKGHTVLVQTEPPTQDNDERRHSEMDATMLDMVSKLDSSQLEMVAEGAATL